jgi:hypothetical protein
MVELTPEEIKNGWTPEKLEAYLRERAAAASKAVFKKPSLPREQNNRYSVHRWRR